MTTLWPPSDEVLDPTETLIRSRPRRSWRNKFRDAIRGLKLGVRGHSSFFVHFFFTALVLAAAVVLRCGLLQWCLLLRCTGVFMGQDDFACRRKGALAPFGRLTAVISGMERLVSPVRNRRAALETP